mmetsp:Transcript_23601/g.93262  ORF Transcript_23601/g.93262 Transcript_23601/m.93262 type:complete len:196 (-) Transcript_23601:1303-1890(-)|eukprot:CAMPEP_0113963792 /NCGR_PEP_ID=MMETSP0011_2-20120614/6735_1 /TAXON_ID=101924 /ORGANISM="Rhodosorus marinus" /LENGTH=195 /DNA_ID=CAMNT_0000975931 /DNA_START=292 /DNA_END=879 /DNA_ORIENTATION=+ /assembly_acc=CAM_ASM_000156
MLAIFRRRPEDSNLFEKPEVEEGIVQDPPSAKRRRRFLRWAQVTPQEQLDDRVWLKVSVRGDGRCMFRAIAKGLADCNGLDLSDEHETMDADKLRVKACQCLRNEKRECFVKNGLLEEPIDEYCKKMVKPSFYGGEPELYLLSEYLKRPIHVYVPGKKQGEYKRLLEYGGTGEEKDAINLLFNMKDHYDLLIINC